jgi:hypothetical protein
MKEVTALVTPVATSVYRRAPTLGRGGHRGAATGLVLLLAATMLLALGDAAGAQAPAPDPAPDSGIAPDPAPGSSAPRSTPKRDTSTSPAPVRRAPTYTPPAVHPAPSSSRSAPASRGDERPAAKRASSKSARRSSRRRGDSRDAQPSPQPPAGGLRVRRISSALSAPAKPLVGARGGDSGGDGALVPAALALILLVVASGSLLRLSAPLLRGPGAP